MGVPLRAGTAGGGRSILLPFLRRLLLLLLEEAAAVPVAAGMVGNSHRGFGTVAEVAVGAAVGGGAGGPTFVPGGNLAVVVDGVQDNGGGNVDNGLQGGSGAGSNATVAGIGGDSSGGHDMAVVGGGGDGVLDTTGAAMAVEETISDSGGGPVRDLSGPGIPDYSAQMGNNLAEQLGLQKDYDDGEVGGEGGQAGVAGGH